MMAANIKSEVPIYFVNAFVEASNPDITGNPAAVCILNRSVDERWMLNIAKQMNLSETAFLDRKENGYQLRWFTPEVEVNLCGHATLASAHVLWEIKTAGEINELTFETKSGTLIASRAQDGIILVFPAIHATPVNVYKDVAAAVGVEPSSAAQSHHCLILEISSEEELRKLQPDFEKLKRCSVRAVAVTCKGNKKPYDFVSRYFAPKVGVNEDPVTGSAHCSLAPFWAKKLGKTELLAFQASSRGGALSISLKSDRVYLKGKAKTVMKGQLI